MPTEDPSCSPIEQTHYRCRASRKHLRLSKLVDRVVLSRAESTNPTSTLSSFESDAPSLPSLWMIRPQALKVKALIQRQITPCASMWENTWPTGMSSSSSSFFSCLGGARRHRIQQAQNLKMKINLQRMCVIVWQ